MGEREWLEVKGESYGKDARWECTFIENNIYIKYGLKTIVYTVGISVLPFKNSQ